MHRLFFERGYVVEIRNPELLRVAIRNDHDETLLPQFVWPVCLEKLYGGVWQIVFDVAPSAGEPFDPTDKRPAFVRWYVGETKLERKKAFRGMAIVERTYWQVDPVEFEIRFEKPVTLVIE